MTLVKLAIAGVKKLGKELAKDTGQSVMDNMKNDLTETLTDAVSDAIHSMVAGQENIEAWAENAAKGIDSIIQNTVIDKEWQYVGGKLRFAYSKRYSNKIDISFDLYFLDDNQQWHKESATSDVYESTFTKDSLEELQKAGVIEYEIQG